MKITYFIFFAFLLFSCSNEERYSSFFIDGNDIYIVGEANNEASLWKNGDKIDLDSAKGSESYASSVFVSGNDVYIVGEVKGKPVLWKNYKFFMLDNEANFSKVSDVFVSGSDVYVAGNVQYFNNLDKQGNLIFDKKNDIVLWKNGKKIMLGYNYRQSNYTIANSGKFIYVGGDEIIDGRYSGTIWEIEKSEIGNKIDIDVSAATEIANSDIGSNSNVDGSYFKSNHIDFGKIGIKDFCVVNGDIFALGEDNNSNQYVFKNKKIIQKTSNVDFSSLFVSGNDIYVGGRLLIGDGGAKVWKNGKILTDFSKDYWSSQIIDIYVDGDNIYIIANGTKTENGNWEGIFWKNGKLIDY